MAIDSENKRRNIGGVYYVPNGAIDSQAERMAVMFMYKVDVPTVIAYELLELLSEITLLISQTSLITKLKAWASGITILVDEESRI